MEWTDEGFVVARHPYGEGSLIATLLTSEHGCHRGLIRGSRRTQSLTLGDRVRARWRGRLVDHLGTLTCETVDSIAGRVLTEPDRLAALAAAAAVCASALPERVTSPEVFVQFEDLLAALDLDPAWPQGYVRWELAFLAALGFGLDLQVCAATGRNDQLAYVSPRTGRAVSLSAGEPYRDRLLPLPTFLLHAPPEPPNDAPPRPAPRAAGTNDVSDGLCLTGYFLERHVFAELGKRLPPARVRLAERWSQGKPVK